MTEFNQGYRFLAPEQVASFWENGFLDVGKILDDDIIEVLRHEYDQEFGLGRAGQRPVRNLAPNTDSQDNEQEQEMLQFMQISEHNVHFNRLTYHETILDIIEDILGPNIQLYHNQALYKPAHHGGPIFWHQDNAYWQCRPANIVSCWLTLDDVTLENGAMQFVPGSHLRPMNHERAEGSDILLDMGGETNDVQSVVVELPAGGASLHHCQTLHRTAPNTTNRQRRAFAAHYMTPGTKSARTNETIGVSFAHPMVRMSI
ncbi:MAG: phytanoyl-CoA dioxygenase family protein [Chloroflexota bacterium]